MRFNMLIVILCLAVFASVPAFSPAGADEVQKVSGKQFAQLAMGGVLYDNWLEVLGVKVDKTHPSYPPEGKEKGAVTWRCKECHGWDYKGRSGAFLSGSHFTGITGIRGAANLPIRPTGVASFSPERKTGTRIFMSLIRALGSARRLTTHWGIDVGGSWSPDGRRIAFCSARSGTPQIYIMSPGDEGSAQRVTFEGDYNCSPSWSPDGRHIAFAGRRSGSFQIFVVPAAGGSSRQLTFAGSNEDPTWSPDARYIAFSGRRGGQKKIYMTDLQGRWERQLTDGPGNDSSPACSRRLN